MLSSPKDPNAEIPTQRIRKPKPAPFDPESYVSAQDEAAKREAQSHVSYAFKTTMTMCSELAQAEPQSYDEAVNHLVYAKEWIMAIQEEFQTQA